MKLCTVILHYGNPLLTARLVEVLRTANPDFCDLRVFDNAAPLSFPDAWRRAETNLYWAGALDVCLDLAEREGFSHIWFLNNDIHFLAPPRVAAVLGRLAKLNTCLERPVGLWSPALESNPYHPQMRPVACRHAVRRVRLLDCPAPVLRLEAVREAGGLDAADNPFGYGVDLWLSWRVAALGWPVLVDQDIVLRHRAHTTAKTVDGFLTRAAQTEETFCGTRFGPDWRDRLEVLKREDAASEKIFYPYGDDHVQDSTRFVVRR